MELGRLIWLIVNSLGIVIVIVFMIVHERSKRNFENRLRWRSIDSYSKTLRLMNVPEDEIDQFVKQALKDPYYAVQSPDELIAKYTEIIKQTEGDAGLVRVIHELIGIEASI